VQNVLHHALLGVSVAALGGAALRLASLPVADGLARPIAAAAFGVAAAVLEALALGLVGLGTSSVALALAAALTWIAAWRALPEPRVRVWDEVMAWWRGLPLAGRIVAAALIGAGLAWLAWAVRYPSLGIDPSVYHYTEVALWVQDGSPGSIERINYDLPFGSYPLTNEVLLAWLAGLSRGFVALSLWPAALGLLLGASGWVGLRALRVPRAVAAAAVAAVLSLPWLVRELNEPLTDLASLAWLAAAAALCATAVARERAALLAPALVALGLAVGTKTTAIVPALALAVVSAWVLRGRLRSLTLPLGLAAIAALGVGGVWYLRNVVQHGSPSWPFVTTPWGDARPRFVELIGPRFADRPIATLDGRSGEYASHLAGALAILAAGLAMPLLVRRREVAIAGGVTALALLAWTLAPVTGLTESSQVVPPGLWSISTTRYLLPVVGCAALAVALGSRGGGSVPYAFALLAFGVAIVWNLIEDVALGGPYLPRWSTLAAGVLAGLVVLAALELARRRLARPSRPARRSPVERAAQRQTPSLAPLRPLVLAALAALAGAALAPAASGFVERHTRVADSGAAGRDAAAWLATHASDDERVAVIGRTLTATLAGDHFKRPIELLPRNTPCAAVERRAREGLVLIRSPEYARGFLGVEPIPAARCLQDRRPVGTIADAGRLYRLRLDELLGVIDTVGLRAPGTAWHKWFGDRSGG
jgi:hypothetical protein